MSRLRASATLLALVAGCAHEREPHRARQRQFDPGAYASAAGTTNATAAGSLFAGGARGLIEDERARSIGDVLVVQIDESDFASHDSTTRLSRSAKENVGLSGAIENLDPNFKIKDLFGAQADSSLDGGGHFQRRGVLAAMLPVRVRRVLPNGDLYIEGTKVVLVGEEERELYLSGVVRPFDIRADGSVASSRIADAEIEYTGRGDATDAQQPGWLSRIMRSVWPF